MNSRDAIQQELSALGSSVANPNHEQPVFTVPDGYFENLAATVLAKIKNEPEQPAAELQSLSPVLAAISKQTPFTVPENYFSLLADDLPAFAGESLPAVLQNHTKQMPYAVPKGYFDALAAQVAAKVVEKSGGKLVHMRPRFMRYAAAAAITAAMAIGAWLYFGNRTTSIDPAAQPDAWVAQKLKNVSNQDLDAFLTNTGTTLNNNNSPHKSEAEVRQMMNDISTKEMDAFLNAILAENDLSNTN